MIPGQEAGRTGLVDMDSIATILTALGITATFVGCLFSTSTWTTHQPDGTVATMSEGFGSWAAWVAAAAALTTILIYLAGRRLDSDPKVTQVIQALAMVLIGGAGVFTALHMRNIVDRSLAPNETFDMAIGLPIATLGCLIASGAIAWSILLNMTDQPSTTANRM
ncbi:MAG TPA: hypothetical protein PK691_07980 [Thermomicrobiales bacterium]|nr:hypothetical protein [Thermomicrobiales bacterium]HRA49039.1 hypothetical protein [Thermomicrobiales bacterium]